LNKKEQNLLASDISTDVLRKMYATMVKIRKCMHAGVCSALKRDDYVVSTHRSHGHFIACMQHESLGLRYFHPPKTEQILTEVLSLPMYPEKHQLIRRKLK